MSVVSSRDLRNHTSTVLRTVASGERVTITVHGEAVAEIGPVEHRRPRYLSRAELIGILERSPADAGLRDDLARLAGGHSDDRGDR